MSAGDLLRVEIVGSSTCPTPACGQADVVDIGERRLLVCQNCGGHHGYSGWTLSKIQQHREEKA